ncbi:GntR family transcriptional regulator [Streptomyces sp. ISL-44]|uniref:GntR family transcriptional regulator n=1 Tax=Streptomyces sp. ISL-44 TaxID=2819184 RepID=UPI0025534BFB|nr:GntR family transcriptional regulator [Streptomyces sp. ISL-44]
MRRLTWVTPLAPIPAVGEIARRYRIPYSTAQFVRRAVVTRLRPAVRPTEGREPVGFRPAWQRVADDLRERIHSGHLRGRLPVRSELAAEYGVSADTVSRAVQTLQEAGLLANAGFRGTHVCFPASDPGE